MASRVPADADLLFQGTSSEGVVPDEGFKEGRVVVKACDGGSSELYELRDGRLHFVKRLPTQAWKDGDHCPKCRSTRTQAIEVKHVNDGEYFELGSSTPIERNPREVAVVKCDACGKLSEMDPLRP